MTATSADRADRVGQVLAEYDRRQGAGGPLDLWGFLSEYQDVAGELIGHFERVNRVAGAVAPPPAPGGTPARSAAGDRYVFLRELGRGGMGVVSLMRQPGLGRDVAVKTLFPGDLPSADRLRRFAAEARLAGGLGHPNIVTVYETGTADGRPYYAMEYVPGPNLREELAGGVLDFAPAARLVAALAAAAEAAHANGVVHRDIKPANVLLGPAGGRPDALPLRGPAGPAVVPKLTDFGLAWGPEDGADRVTRPDDVLGTPQYMPPEQAGGRMAAVGPTADVYALGAVLYECLTGRAPFEGATPVEVLDQVRRDEPVPPGRLRPGIPRDLETVCLKCLEKAPGRRYATAAELAADLNRFVAGEPVLARRPSRVERLRRWVRRHPRTAAWLAAGAVAAVGFTVFILLANRALAAERDRTAEQRDRARELLGLTRGAVNDYTTRLSNDPRIRTRDLEDLRKELLATAVGYYEALTKLSGDAPEVRAERARGYGQLAEITAQTGATADALPHYEKALEAFEGLVRDHPEAAEYRRGLAVTLNQRATLLRRTGEPDRAEADRRRAIDLYRQLADAPGATPYDRQALAGECGNLANLLAGVGRPEAAVEFYAEARTVQQALADAHPGEPRFARDLASTRRHIGLTLIQTGRFKEADDELTAARAAEQELFRRHPADGGYLTHLTATLNNLALLYTDTGRPGEAEKVYQVLVRLAADWATAHPKLLAAQSDLGKALNNLGTLLADLGRDGDGEKVLVRARDIRLKLVAADPTNTDYQHDLAGTFNNLGLAAERLGRLPDAAAAYAEARKLRDRLAAAGLPDTAFRADRASLLHNLFNLHMARNDFAAAEKALDERESLLRPLTAAHPDHPEYALGLSRVAAGRGDLATDRRQWDAALTAYREALALRRKLAAAHPTVIEYQRLLVNAHNNIGRIHHLAGQVEAATNRRREAADRFAAAEKEGLEAIRISGELARRLPGLVSARRGLVLGRNNLATLYGEAARVADPGGAAAKLAESEKAFRQGLADAADLARDFAPLPRDRQLVAALHNGLGVTYNRTRRPELAAREYQAAVGIAEGLHREFPDAAEYAESLGLYYGNVGEITADADGPDPLGWFDKSVAVLGSLHKAQPQNADARKYLTQSYAKRAQFLADLGRDRAAAKDWEAAAAVAPPELAPRQRLELACCLARLKDHARATGLADELVKGPNLSGENLADLATVYTRAAADREAPEADRERRAAAAVGLLRRAAGTPFLGTPAAASRVLSDPRYAAIKDRADFKALWVELAQPKPKPTPKAGPKP